MNFTIMYKIINEKYIIKTNNVNKYIWENSSDLKDLLNRKKMLYRNGENPDNNVELYKIEFFISYIYNYLKYYMIALYTYIFNRVEENKFSEINLVYTIFDKLHKEYEIIKSQLYYVL